MSLQKLTYPQIALKALSGFGGGVCGTFVLLIIFILGSSVFKSVFEIDGDEIRSINPIFIFAYIVMIFLSTLTSNIVSPLLISLTEKTKYKRINSILYQIFIANLVLFFITAPLYIIIISIDLRFLGYITILHVVLSIVATSLILEIIADMQYSLLALYSIIVAILVSTIINLIAFKITNSPVSLLFIGLPILWGGIGSCLGLSNLTYNAIANAYGIDFLNPTINYGEDDKTDIEIEQEQQREEQISEAKQKRKEDTGAAFLNKNG